MSLKILRQLRLHKIMNTHFQNVTKMRFGGEVNCCTGLYCV